MGYGTVTVRITGRQSVKIETTGRHIELEANHRWEKCNYPFFLFILLKNRYDFLYKSNFLHKIDLILFNKNLILSFT